jgi:hypothetical protein
MTEIGNLRKVAESRRALVGKVECGINADFERVDRMNRSRTKAIRMETAVAYAMLIFGIVSIAVSFFNASAVLALIGLGLAFWGALLRYINPSKQVPLELLTASASSTLADIEKMLTDFHLTEKGIYLPPKYLKDFDSSLVFVPSKHAQTLPTPEEVDETKLRSGNPGGIFLTPPGLALSRLLEKELGTSFTNTNLNIIQEKLAKLLVEGTEIAENVETNIEKETVTIEITNHIFKELCRETTKLTKTHKSIGCPLSSAIACALAKATGKPIVIEKEEQSQDGKTTKIQYHILED